MNAPYEEGREMIAMSADESMVSMISRAEIDQQISTAKKYPRSIKRFTDEATAMVTLNESIARQCIYALPRDGKVVEGASARFAEIIASAWGNCRAGARVVNESGEFITAQGVFHDLERNVAITYEVQRRITNKKGQRFSADMIGVTGNAASSIALRNAILKGVPKAFWEHMYQHARAVVAGDVRTLATKRAEAIKQFQIYGVTEVQILAKLGREGVADIGLDDLVILFGMLTAIRDGDTTPEQAFAAEGEAPKQGQPPAAPKEKASYSQVDFDKNLPAWRKLIADGKKTADQIIATAGSKAPLTAEQVATLKNNPAQSAEGSAQTSGGAGAAASNPVLTDTDKLIEKMRAAGDVDTLDAHADLIGTLPADDQENATAIYKARRAELNQ